MPRAQDQLSKGPIKGLVLSRHAWTSLGRVGVDTLPHLKEMLGRLERLPGIGPKTAQAIRAEVERVTGQKAGKRLPIRK